MESRQQTLLQRIIEEHIRTTQPVGSNLMADKYFKDLSSPTIRNEMQALERAGYITHPHTSAGRVPTEAGYRFYIENLLPAKAVPNREAEALAKIIKASRGYEEQAKRLAKKTAEFASLAVVVGFSPQDVYYTGLSNVFSQPEFASHDLVVGLSQVIDHLDEVMSKIHKRIDDEISVLLGSDNPFGQECGSVLTRCSFDSGRGVIGILGPMRMDYGENIAYVKFIKKLLEK